MVAEQYRFSLLKSDKTIDLSSYAQAVRDEPGAFGLEMTVTEKIMGKDSPVKSAFSKGGTQIHLLRIQPVLASGNLWAEISSSYG
jgi:hypothetical protein